MRFFVLLLLLLSAPSFAAGWALNLGEFGAESYVCNAGIQHSEFEGAMCFDSENETCSISDCAEGEDCNCKCVESDASQSMFSAKYKKLKDVRNDRGDSSTKTVQASGKPGFATLFKEGNKSWKNQINTLNFNLGAPNLASKFFVDVCYLGPVYTPSNPEKPREGFDLSEGYYSFSLSSFVESISNTDVTDYLSTAGLKSSMDVSCDLRSLGSNRNPRKLGDLPKEFEEDYFQDFMNLPMQKAGLLFEGLINQISRQSPRYCRVRHTFGENNPKALRKWVQGPSDFKFDLSIIKN